MLRGTEEKGEGMSGLGAGLLRALVGKTPKPTRAKRDHERKWRRRWLMTQQAVLGAAQHDLDAKPPTELHRTFQEARRSDPVLFSEECLPHFMGLPPKKVVIPASFPRR